MALQQVQAPPIQGSVELQKQLLCIEQKLKFSKNSPAVREELFFALEGTQKSLQALQQKTTTIGVFAKYALSKNADEFLQAQTTSQIEELNQLSEKIIALYGDFYALEIDEEITDIRNEAEILGQALSSGDLLEICKNIHVLSKHIDTFCRNHRPSREDRHIIAFARETLKKADQIVFNKVLGSTLNQFNLLALKTARQEWVDDDELESEIAMLFEVAELYYCRYFKSAQSQFNQLPQRIKKRVLAHFEHTSKNGCEWQQDVYPMVQALMAAVHEISDSTDGSGYLDAAGIDLMFQEINAIKAEDASSMRKKLPQMTMTS